MTGLRDRLLAEGMPASEYFKLENHTFSKGLGIKSQAKSETVPADPYESGKSENQVRTDCKKLLKTWGWISRTIYTGGIPIGGGGLGTNPAVGIADQYVCHPIHRQRFWLELKRNSGGKLSPEQQTFRWDVQHSGGIYILATSARLLEEQMIIHNLFNGAQLC